MLAWAAYGLKVHPRISHKFIPWPYVSIWGISALLKGRSAMLWRCAGTTPLLRVHLPSLVRTMAWAKNPPLLCLGRILALFVVWKYRENSDVNQTDQRRVEWKQIRRRKQSHPLWKYRSNSMAPPWCSRVTCFNCWQASSYELKFWNTNRCDWCLNTHQSQNTHSCAENVYLNLFLAEDIPNDTSSSWKSLSWCNILHLHIQALSIWNNMVHNDYRSRAIRPEVGPFWTWLFYVQA